MNLVGNRTVIVSVLLSLFITTIVLFTVWRTGNVSVVEVGILALSNIVSYYFGVKIGQKNGNGQEVKPQ